VRTYIEFSKKAFQKALVYRIEVLISLVYGIVSILIYFYLWSALYQNQPQVKGITLKEVITYSAISIIIRQLARTDTTFLIEDKMRTGDIATDLMKPIDLGLYLFSDALGQSWFTFLAKILPVFSIAFFVFKIILPPGSLFFFSFLVSVFLGYMIIFCIWFMIGMIGFWTREIYGFCLVMEGIIAFFSGSLVPLWFFPKLLQRIAFFLPFKAIYFTPLSIYLGKVPSSQIVWVLMQQALWAIGLIIGARLIQVAATRKVVIQGG